MLCGVVLPHCCLASGKVTRMVDAVDALNLKQSLGAIQENISRRRLLSTQSNSAGHNGRLDRDFPA